MSNGRAEALVNRIEDMSGLYIHIPYCHSKCAYCDFYSRPIADNAESYIEALLGELEIRLDEIPANIHTIYIGGGTPSILSKELFTRLTSGIFSKINTSSLKEFTVEVNPEDVSNELLQFYQSCGVNRISMGIQSFNDECLKAVERRHNAATAIEAMELLSKSGINYSADLIFGLPKQDISIWESSLRKLLSYKPPHFSAYLLSYEPGTRLYARLISGKVTEASEKLSGEMYQLLTQLAQEAGYCHYEISNYALPEYNSMHNSNYWNYTPYLGLGVSAHSFDGNIRRFNPNNINEYIARIKAGRTYYEVEKSDIYSKFNEYIITSLRTKNGLNLKKLKNIFPEQITTQFEQDASNLISVSKLLSKDDQITIPEKDWLISDAILRELIQIED